MAAHPATTLVIDERARRGAGTFQVPNLPGTSASAPPSLISVEGYVVGVATEQAAVTFSLATIQEAGVVDTEVEGIGLSR